jgi:hypothetical protein
MIRLPPRQPLAVRRPLDAPAARLDQFLHASLDLANEDTADRSVTGIRDPGAVRRPTRHRAAAQILDGAVVQVDDEDVRVAAILSFLPPVKGDAGAVRR